MKNTALFVNAATALYMCGVIWVIQLIHYPSFLNISPDRFHLFHQQHTTAMGILVGPVMIAELVVAAWILYGEQQTVHFLNLALVIALWSLTFFVSVPLHNKLSLEYSPDNIQKLITTNWPRTALWTARALVSGFLILRQVKP